MLTTTAAAPQTLKTSTIAENREKLQDLIQLYSFALLITKSDKTPYSLNENLEQVREKLYQISGCSDEELEDNITFLANSGNPLRFILISAQETQKISVYKHFNFFNLADPFCQRLLRRAYKGDKNAFYGITLNPHRIALLRKSGWIPLEIPGSILEGDFTNQDFSNANLTLVDARNALLTGANFNRSTLFMTNFTGCDLSNTTFIQAIIATTNFTKSNISEKDLVGIIIRENPLGLLSIPPIYPLKLPDFKTFQPFSIPDPSIESKENLSLDPLVCAPLELCYQSPLSFPAIGARVSLFHANSSIATPTISQEEIALTEKINYLNNLLKSTKEDEYLIQCWLQKLSILLTQYKKLPRENTQELLIKAQQLLAMKRKEIRPSIFPASLKANLKMELISFVGNKTYNGINFDLCTYQKNKDAANKILAIFKITGQIEIDADLSEIALIIETIPYDTTHTATASSTASSTAEENNIESELYSLINDIEKMQTSFKQSISKLRSANEEIFKKEFVPTRLVTLARSSINEAILLIAKYDESSISSLSTQALKLTTFSSENNQENAAQLQYRQNKIIAPPSSESFEIFLSTLIEKVGTNHIELIASKHECLKKIFDTKQNLTPLLSTSYQIETEIKNGMADRNKIKPKILTLSQQLMEIKLTIESLIKELPSPINLEILTIYKTDFIEIEDRLTHLKECIKPESFTNNRYSSFQFGNYELEADQRIREKSKILITKLIKRTGYDKFARCINEEFCEHGYSNINSLICRIEPLKQYLEKNMKDIFDIISKQVHYFNEIKQEHTALI